MIAPQLRIRLKTLLKDVLCPDNRYQLAASSIGKLRMDNQVVAIVLKAVNSLPDREKNAVHLKYGLGKIPPMTHQKLAEIMGVSAARSQQIVAKGKRMMRHPVRIDKIVSLLEILSVSN
jgi:DNA-directed RNA polymerase sigma subunit (sigma70/sigma32)